jgi:hypothetical protein
MRVIISVIVILILLLLLALLIQSSFIKETFISEKDLDDIKKYKGRLTIEGYDTIDDPISDSLIPYNPKAKVELSEYEVIELTKSILQRPPTIEEMNKYSYLSSNNLKEYLYNSPEYDKLIKTQDNHVNNGIEGAIAKKNLINRIMTIYSNIIKKEIPVKMMLVLRDCFIHLQLNDFLFVAMLESFNYKKFEVDVLSTYVLTKKVLLHLFNKHFNVLELKLIAQDKINTSNNKILDFTKEIEGIKNDILSLGDDKVVNTIKSAFPNVFNEIVKSTLKSDISSNTLDLNIINKYLKGIENYENIHKEEKEEKKEKIEEKLTIDNDVIKKLPENSELYVRVYDPIKRNMSYIIPEGYKPPICTSLGQDNLTQPVFTQSKLLFQGTDLNDAFEKSQIGSIMPKFIYKEYKDIKIN